jgi:polyisoprenyl-phosphate glycosyltransferase
MYKSKLISVVVPVLNEQGNIPYLYRSLIEEFDQLWYDFEVIFVDDGSRDRSADIIRKLHANDPRVKLVSLSRNFGHQMAVTAGLESARGAAVIMMDADLQHPPAVIPEMIARWQQGFDVVYTVRKTTEGVGLFKRLTSAAYYRLINRIIDTRIIPSAADFRLIDRKVVNCLNGIRERSRFVRGLVTWVGFRQTAIPYVAAKRHAGTTKYSLGRMLSFAVDGITSFSTFPLRCSTYLGFLSALAGIPYAVWAIYLKLFTDATVSGWSSLIVAVLFLGGVQLIALGILGEYVGRIYEEVKQRPLYLVQETIGFDEHPVDSNGHDHKQLARVPEFTQQQNT